MTAILICQIVSIIIKVGRLVAMENGKKIILILFFQLTPEDRREQIGEEVGGTPNLVTILPPVMVDGAMTKLILIILLLSGCHLPEPKEPVKMYDFQNGILFEVE